MKKKSIKKMGLFLLAVVMVLTVMPFTTAFAAEVNVTGLTVGQLLNAGDTIKNDKTNQVNVTGSNEGSTLAETIVAGGTLTLPNKAAQYKVKSVDNTTVYLQESYKINVESSAGGTATASLTDAFAGTLITMTLTPDPGYEFVGWDASALVEVISDTELRVGELGFNVKANFALPVEHSVVVGTAGNGTVSATPASALKGTQITLTATPDPGYRFKKWLVVSGGVTVTDNTFTMPNKNVELSGVFEAIPPVPTPGPNPTSYSFKTGAGSTWTKGGSQAIMFAVDANWDNFVAIKVNGQEVGPSAFEIDFATGTIGLKPMYLDSLKNGTYELSVVFTDGVATTSFTVKDAKTSPKTGNAPDMMFYGILLLVCAGTAAGAVVIQKKLKRTEK